MLWGRGVGQGHRKSTWEERGCVFERMGLNRIKSDLQIQKYSWGIFPQTATQCVLLLYSLHCKTLLPQEYFSRKNLAHALPPDAVGTNRATSKGYTLKWCVVGEGPQKANPISIRNATGMQYKTRLACQGGRYVGPPMQLWAYACTCTA